MCNKALIEELIDRKVSYLKTVAKIEDSTTLTDKEKYQAAKIIQDNSIHENIALEEISS